MTPPDSEQEHDEDDEIAPSRTLGPKKPSKSNRPSRTVIILAFAPKDTGRVAADTVLDWLRKNASVRDTGLFGFKSSERSGIDGWTIQFTTEPNVVNELASMFTTLHWELRAISDPRKAGDEIRRHFTNVAGLQATQQIQVRYREI